MDEEGSGEVARLYDEMVAFFDLNRDHKAR